MKVIEAIDKYLIEMNLPRDFRASNPDNVLKEIDMAYENVCAAMEGSGIVSPKKLSQFEFLQRMEYLQKKNKRGKKG